MGDKHIRIDLDEFDRYQSDQLTTYAGAMLPRMVEAGLTTAEEAEADTAAALALATRLRADLPHHGQWVVIRRRLSYGAALDAASMATRRDDAGRTYTDESSYRLAVMERAIVAWSILDEDQEPLERGPEGIRNLDEDLGKWLYFRIDEQRAFSKRSKEQMAALKSDTAVGDDAA